MLLNNLISNAVKYNRDGGSVDVTLPATNRKRPSPWPIRASA